MREIKRHHESDDDIFVTSLDLLEIDITFECNLWCLNCDRSCRQAPEDTSMTVNQLEMFIEESEGLGHEWIRIRLMGGEPFLHPDILEILSLFEGYKMAHPSTFVEVVTNGFGSHVRDLMCKTPAGISVKDTGKTSPHISKFEAFNIAPIDIGSTDDFTKGCWITEECGLGLNPYGFYHCGVAGSIDRVFGLDIGLKHIPSQDESLDPIKSMTCSLCGHFTSRWFRPVGERIPVAGEPQTVSWKNAYKEFGRRMPVLMRY